MEFGVATFSAVAAVVISKLCVVMENILKKVPEIRADVRCIKEDLEAIEAAIELHGLNREHVIFIAQLRRLAYDIEDCIDRFDAKKMVLKDFAKEIVLLKETSTNTTNRIQNFNFLAEEDDRIAQGQGAADVPAELQNLGDYNPNCLLYLCLFPRNHQVRTKPLARRWLAEGLVQGEHLAVKNMKILTNSSIFSSIQRSNNGEVRRCQPTNETFRYISQQSVSENFVLFCDGAAQPSQGKSLQAQVARRLSVHPSANVQLNLPQDLSRLRTLAVFPAGEVNLASYEDVLDFARYQVLRVLDLKECTHLSEEHLRDIWSQVLIKYLSINLGSIAEINSSIKHLDQLETLDLSGSQTVTVFKEVLLLPKLKHLFGRFQLSKRDTFTPGWLLTSGLQEFLKRKSKLETLAGFVTNERLGFPQLLNLMKQLRKVKIWFESDASERNVKVLSKSITEFIGAGVTQPDLNRSLSIEFEECSGKYANNISQVAGILASLKLRGNLAQFPPFVAGLSAIEELCLWSTGLSWEVIRAGLSRVRGLKYLKLIEDNLGRLDILSEAEHLKAIERICVVCKQRLEVAIAARPLPNLVSLHILCQDLHRILDNPLVEITRMAKLQEVALHHQVDDTTKDELRRIAYGHPNTPKVLFLEYLQ
ncbi:disease resistance protein RGA4-like [Triticum urartu]|nr:disease resistance protein RGA4-like [Triticum urartu]